MTDDQMLIDIHGEEVAPCIPVARKYRATITKRMAIQEKEVDLKDELSALVRAAGLKPLADGIIHFKYEGGDILVAPGKDKVKVVIDE